jgi:hypothetical protein
MSGLAWGSEQGNSSLEIVLGPGNYRGQALQLKQDGTAPHPVHLTVHGEGRAEVRGLALDLEAATIEVADLVFADAPSTFALKLRTPESARMQRLAFLDQQVGSSSGPAHAGVVLLEASGPAVTAMIGDCAFVSGKANVAVPMIAILAQPQGVFEEVRVERSLMVDENFPALVNLFSAKSLVWTDSLMVLSAGGRALVVGNAAWNQLTIRDSTVVADGPEQVFQPSKPGITLSAPVVSGRFGWRSPSPAPDFQGERFTVDEAGVAAGIGRLKSALRKGPVGKEEAVLLLGLVAVK